MDLRQAMAPDQPDHCQISPQDWMVLRPMMPQDLPDWRLRSAQYQMDMDRLITPIQGQINLAGDPLDHHMEMAATCPCSNIGCKAL